MMKFNALKNEEKLRANEEKLGAILKMACWWALM